MGWDAAPNNGSNGTAGKLLFWLMGIMATVLIAGVLAQFQQTATLVQRVAVLEVEMREARTDISETKKSLQDPSDEQLRRWRREAAAEEAAKPR